MYLLMIIGFLECKPGWFGLNCEKKCSCLHGEDCDFVSGRCLHCKSGWIGNNCEKSKDKLSREDSC